MDIVLCIINLVFLFSLSGEYITMSANNCNAFLWKKCTSPPHWHGLGCLTYLGHNMWAEGPIGQFLKAASTVMMQCLRPKLSCGFARSLALFSSFRKIPYPIWTGSFSSLDFEIKRNVELPQTQNSHVTTARNKSLEIFFFFWSFVSAAKMTNQDSVTN